MSVQLCIDFGNTLVKAAVFHGREMKSSIRCDYSEAVRELNKVIEKDLPSVGNYSTVKALSPEILRWLEDHAIIQMTSMRPSPVKILYKSPETLGVDRYCNAIAGWAMNRPQPVLVIDAGSCVTYDLVNGKGEYLGGAISPGFEMRLKAMYKFTSKLPLVSKSVEKPSIGQTTEGSMKLGAEQGIIEEVKGFIQYFKGLEPDLKVILTGGDQTIFEQHLENAIFAAQNLVLLGLNEVLLHSDSD